MQSDLENRYAALEETLGYIFKNRRLLTEALTHPSYANEVRGGEQDNQRLEFFGDSIVSFLISNQLYLNFPVAREGELTKLRAAIVDEAALARVALAFDLGSFLSLGRGEERSGGRSKSSVLADALEALVAAVYLDGGVTAAKRVVNRLFAPSLVSAATNRGQSDFKTELQELVQSRFAAPPQYIQRSAEGPDHSRSYTYEVIVNGSVAGVGSGGSKKSAQQAAAQEALAELSK